ncbi:DMT family transporter [Cohnella silvisoli]|uniref:DMT family transporter n=1 Tax=Cohnella silvisoli TaxID=2873699 RepID=A0ABV1KWQ8_9BACL|nr:DMT family transporter [Cohnella silvisoli]MCD9023959.1 DMT family transporter [Cohnella silvisoli]
MFLFSVLLVIGSGLTHAVWNLFAKKSNNKSVFLWSMLALTSLILLPSFLSEMFTAALPLKAYVLIVLSLLLQGCYAVLLTKTYDNGELSQVYPIMRGTGTLLIPVIGVVFLGESLSAWGWAGLACIISGFFILSGWSFRMRARKFAFKPVMLAMGVGLCTTCYVWVDKINLQYLSPLSLLEIANIGFMLALTPAVLGTKQLKEEWANNWKQILLGSVLNPGSYLLFLFAMLHAPIAHISPIREIGTVFATLLGVLILKERQGFQRIMASVLIVIGIIAISAAG